MTTIILQSLFCKYYVFGNFGSNKNEKNIKSCAGILVYFVLFKLQLIRTSLKRRMYSICHDCNPLYTLVFVLRLLLSSKGVIR